MLSCLLVRLLRSLLMLGSSQDSSNHMRIPVEKGWLWSMGSQRVRHNWATELNWRESGNLQSPERAGAAKVRWRFQEIQGSSEFESWRCHRHLQPGDKSSESSLETLDPFACAPAASWKDNSRASLPSAFSFLDNCLFQGSILSELCPFSSVQFSHSVMSDFVTPWIAAHQASLSITDSRSSLKLPSIKSVMPSSL